MKFIKPLLAVFATAALAAGTAAAVRENWRPPSFEQTQTLLEQDGFKNVKPRLSLEFARTECGFYAHTYATKFSAERDTAQTHADFWNTDTYSFIKHEKLDGIICYDRTKQQAFIALREKSEEDEYSVQGYTNGLIRGKPLQ